MDEDQIEQAAEAGINAIRLNAWSMIYADPTNCCPIERAYPKMLPSEWGSWLWHDSITQTVIQLRTNPDTIPSRDTFEVVLAKIIIGVDAKVGESKRGGTIMARIQSLREVDSF